MFNGLSGIRAITIGAAALMATSNLASPVSAQRGEDWEWQGSYQRVSRLNPGTFLTIRTTQPISSDRFDGRVFSGLVAEDVWDDYRRLAVPAIPRGSRAELIVRTARDGDLVLDLESILAHGQRYAVNAAPERVESNNWHGRDGNDAAAFVGGGAILGTIIGSIAGGGHGAAIGATAGAATGLGLALSGRSIRVPSGTLLTFRLNEGLVMGTVDRGYSQGQWHYHRYPGDPAYPSQPR